MDAWIHEHQGNAFDENGNWAGKGKLNEALLEKVLEIYAALNDHACPDARLGALLQEAHTLGVRFDKIIPAIVDMRRVEEIGLGERA